MIDNIHPTVEIENLNFSYQGKPLLSIDYLKMDKPGITVVLGPNGAGKSMLLKCLLGFFKPDNGQIIKSPDLKVSYVPQDFISDKFML